MNIHDQDTFYRGKKEGIQEGKQEKAIETARKLLDMGETLEKTMIVTGLPLETVEELATSITQ